MRDRIYKTHRGKLKAIAKEIEEKHKSGQPVLVGTISIEKNEELGALLEKAGVPHNLLNAKFHEKEAEYIAQAGRKAAVTIATNMAGRGVDITLGGVPFDKAKHEEVKALGGLHVLGTERHESRRIDNQLRGRAGRQGDPGSSQFYISLGDDLMRIFGSDRMKGIMDRLGIAEDTAIENKMISKSIEAAQKKVEGHNFDIRKHLVEYDDIINKHRSVIYKQRQDILELFTDNKISEDNTNLVFDYINQEIENVVSFHTLASKNNGDFDPKEIIETIKTIFPLEFAEEDEIKKLLESNKKNNNHEERTLVIDYIIKIAKEKYAKLAEEINANIDLPEDNPYQPIQMIERGIILRSIDTLWVEHLTAMDKLRTGIGLQGYGQRDPLVEYKREAYMLFNTLLDSIRKQIVYSIFKVGVSRRMAAVPGESDKKFAEQKSGYSPFSKQVEDRAKSGQVLPSKPRDESGKKIGRNDPCPCGSGKKYKQCHGK